MTDTVENLTLDLLEWAARKERTYQETMEAWRTSCRRLPVWKDATIGASGDVFCEWPLAGRETPAGLALLKEKRPRALVELQHLSPQRLAHEPPLDVYFWLLQAVVALATMLTPLPVGARPKRRRHSTSSSSTAGSSTEPARRGTRAMSGSATDGSRLSASSLAPRRPAASTRRGWSSRRGSSTCSASRR